MVSKDGEGNGHSQRRQSPQDGRKKNRDDRGARTQLAAYISARTDVLFSHGLCADCRWRFNSDYARE